MNDEAAGILKAARLREQARARAYVPPDYAGAQAAFTKQKAALTRAVKSGDASKVVTVCRDAVAAWGRAPFNGAWPDDWSRWQRALDDAVVGAPRLEDL